MHWTALVRTTLDWTTLDWTTLAGLHWKLLHFGVWLTYVTIKHLPLMRIQIWWKENMTDGPTNISTDKPVLWAAFHAFRAFFAFYTFNVGSERRQLLEGPLLLFMLLLSTACPSSWNATFYSKWRSVEICFHWTLFLSMWPILRGRDCIGVLSLNKLSWKWSENIFFRVSKWPILRDNDCVSVLSLLCIKLLILDFQGSKLDPSIPFSYSLLNAGLAYFFLTVAQGERKNKIHEMTNGHFKEVRYQIAFSLTNRPTVCFK